MVMASNVCSAYGTIHKTTLTLTGRSLESQVLTKCALSLKECADNWEHPETFSKLLEQLKNNHKVWLLFQQEVANAQCQLPNDIKINIIRLAAFVGQQTMDIYTAPAKEKLSILIDINLNIAAGLQGR
jgi:flagellar protein FlaF